MSLPVFLAIGAGIWIARSLWVSWDASSRAKFGRGREVGCAKYLRSCGAIEVGISPGSRGAADLTVSWPRGRAWQVQLKSSRNGTPKLPSPDERKRLKQVATRSRSVAVVALCCGTRTLYYCARSGERLYPEDWA